jgi:tRNA(Ile2) C34 agmatinyltransferase TiaS
MTDFQESGLEPINKLVDETVLGVHWQTSPKCPKCRMRRMLTTTHGYRCWRCDEWGPLKAAMTTEAPR